LVGAPCILFSSQQASNESNKISINIHIMYIYFLDLNKSIYIYIDMYTHLKMNNICIYIYKIWTYFYLHLYGCTTVLSGMVLGKGSPTSRRVVCRRQLWSFSRRPTSPYMRMFQPISRTQTLVW
jgi:hypothetical protein